MKEREPINRHIFSGDQIAEIFVDGKFGRRIESMITDSINSDNYAETGGWIFVNPRTMRYSFSRSDVAEVFGVGMSGEKRMKLFENKVKKGVLPLISIHSHPPHYLSGRYLDNSFKPSKNDLISAKTIKELMLHSAGYYNAEILNIIVIAQGDSEAKLLLFQSSIYSPKSAKAFDGYEQDMRQSGTLSGITECLRDYGYKADFVDFPFERDELSKVLSTYSIDVSKFPIKDEDFWF